VDEHLIAAAGELGGAQELRGADALFAACALRYRAPLVTFDTELIARAGASLPHRVFLP
jgi:predicted nucleic acid-binding protein